MEVYTYANGVEIGELMIGRSVDILVSLTVRVIWGT